MLAYKIETLIVNFN